MTTEQRLERLERENRWMRRIGAVGVAVAATVFLIGQGTDKEPPDLTVRSLTVVDKDGKSRAQLRTTAEGWPSLTLRDGDGRVWVALSSLADSSTIGVFGKDGVAVVVMAKRTAGKAAVGLTDANRNLRVRLGISPDGPALDLLDENAKVRAALGVTKGMTEIN